MYIGQDPLVASMVQKYIYISIPCQFLMCTFDALNRFMQFQGYFYTVLCFQVILCVFHLAISYMFIFHWEFRYLGAPLSIT